MRHHCYLPSIGHFETILDKEFVFASLLPTAAAVASMAPLLLTGGPSLTDMIADYRIGIQLLDMHQSAVRRRFVIEDEEEEEERAQRTAFLSIRHHELGTHYCTRNCIIMARGPPPTRLHLLLLRLWPILIKPT